MTVEMRSVVASQPRGLGPPVLGSVLGQTSEMVDLVSAWGALQVADQIQPSRPSHSYASEGGRAVVPTCSSLKAAGVLGCVVPLPLP